MNEIDKVKQVAERIKAIRKEDDISQQDAAKLLGVSYRVYQRIEGGQRAPDIDFIYTFCKVFDVKLNKIIK